MGKRTARLTKIRPEPGSRPGTLVSPPGALQPTLTLLYYGVDLLKSKSVKSPKEVKKDGPGIRWLNIEGLGSSKVIEELGATFGIHPLALEDTLHVPQRPKAQSYPGHGACVLRMLSYSEGLVSEQISVLWGEGFLITVQERPGDVFDPVRQRIENASPIRKKGSDYLAYALIDSVVDHTYAVLEKLGEQFDQLDEVVLGDPTPDTLQGIQSLKQELGEVRRTLWSTREAISSLLGEESPMGEDTKLHLRDCLDHCQQLVEMADGLRESSAGLVDLYLSSIGHRTNEVMQHLTLIATIFIPLSFLAGVFGMNFEHMPELKWAGSYPLFWVVVITLTVTMVRYFKRRDWL